MLTFVELIPLFILLGAFTVLLVLLWRMRDVSAPEQIDKQGPSAVDRQAASSGGVQGEPAQEGIRRRRGGLARMRAAVDIGDGAEGSSSGPSDERNDGDESAGPAASGGARVKTKKEANKEARRAAKEEHEARLAAQRERMGKDEEARLAAKEAEEAEEREAEEKARLEAEEKAKQEQDEYAQWKDLICVEDAGDEVEAAREEDPAMLESFIKYVKHNKIVVLEEVAAEFGLKTEAAIERLTALEENGTVTGVFDDRGKFIYVSPEEMREVAEFIRRRGRVSIAELAIESGKLLHLDEAGILA